MLRFCEDDDVVDFDALYKGMKECCRNVRWKDSVVGYEAHGLRNTYLLRQELLNGRYKIQPYKYFTIYEPKKRNIVATRVRDRQFQRTLCNQVLYDEVTRSFIYDNCACQKGKGTDFCLRRIVAHMRRFYIEHGSDGWVLKCDIRRYFDSTRHDVAKAAIQKRVRDKVVAEYACNVIDSFDGDIGIGLGSQISQLTELAVLDDLDHYIKERLRIKHYVRYMDDFVLIHHDKEYLQYCWSIIVKKLAAIGLELNGKTSLYPISQGVKMLHWRFLYTDTGRILRLFDKTKPGKERRKLKRMSSLVQKGKMTMEQLDDCFRSWLANAERGDTYGIRQRMKQFYRRLKEGLCKYGYSEKYCAAPATC